MSAPAAIILCEILAHRRAVADDLANIAQICARDVAMPLKTRVKTGGIGPKKSILTLHLPVELADQQHRIWCLACRLACFCPDTRVSVLVHSASAFASASTQRKHRHSA